MDIYFTIDLDLYDYVGSEATNEMLSAFPIIRRILIENPSLKTTWFIRLDGQLHELYGSADFIFRRFGSELKWLTDNGHELGWHFHSYRENINGWVQNTDELEILQELEDCGNIATEYGLTIVRMGWGYQTNQTMALLANLGFKIDSSAIPRPTYPWETSVKDWSITPQCTYYPGIHDYRIAGVPALPILEFPISSAELQLPSDDLVIQRYLNPAYKTGFFKTAYESYCGRPYVNMVMHPYEILPNEREHYLLSFDSDVLSRNIDFLQENNVVFKTVSEILKLKD